jgi:hypothetical protein
MLTTRLSAGCSAVSNVGAAYNLTPAILVSNRVSSIDIECVPDISDVLDGLSRLELDRLAELPSGYSAKLLGRDGAGEKQKRLWPIGLEAMLGTLGLKVLLIEDEAATARTLALRTPVVRAN